MTSRSDETRSSPEGNRDRVIAENTDSERLTVAELWDKSAEHLALMGDWSEGRRSYTNLGFTEPFTHEVIAAMDVAEVQKHAAAAVAYAQVARARTDG